ncbi:MAG: DUF2892 domain-containing protein [Gammaproteobacteria bacterium]|jgi:hypothetical protein
MIRTIRTKLAIEQNEGWLDRTIRVVVGFAMVFGAAYALGFNFEKQSSWEYYVMLLAIIPLATGMLGWCALYRLFNIRTCGGTEKNPCGTFPYQVDAAIGHHPMPDSETEHSLSKAHHEKHSKNAA